MTAAACDPDLSLLWSPHAHPRLHALVCTPDDGSRLVLRRDLARALEDSHPEIAAELRNSMQPAGVFLMLLSRPGGMTLASVHLERPS